MEVWGMLGVLTIPISGVIGMYLDIKKGVEFRGWYWGLGALSGLIAFLILLMSIN